MFYKAPRTANLYDPKSREPYSLSRSRLENFLRCPRCFYMDRKLGVDQPPGFPFNLNSAVDALFKKEFDIHRAEESAHPLMENYGLEAVPFQHEKMDAWRESNFGKGGVRYLDPETNFDVNGAVDDVWVNPDGELIIVDYKSTSKDKMPGIDADWQIGYRRQMELYQWLFRKNGFKVSDTGYFVYANGKRDAEAFDAKLEFDIELIPYVGNDGWVERALKDAKDCLDGDIPKEDPDCEFCLYRKESAKAAKNNS